MFLTKISPSYQVYEKYMEVNDACAEFKKTPNQYLVAFTLRIDAKKEKDFKEKDRIFKNWIDFNHSYKNEEGSLSSHATGQNMK